MIALKVVKWKITWKKKIFVDLVKDAKSVAGFSPCRQFQARLNDVTHGLAAKPISKWQSPKLIFQDKFLQDSGYFRGRKVSEWKS